MTNLKLFIQEKRNNFTNFLLELFPNSEKVKMDINKYKFIGIPEFLLYVRQNIEPHKDNLESYIQTNFKSYFPNEKYNIEKNNINKLVKYLEMFIDLSK